LVAAEAAWKQTEHGLLQNIQELKTELQSAVTLQAHTEQRLTEATQTLRAQCDQLQHQLVDQQQQTAQLQAELESKSESEMALQNQMNELQNEAAATAAAAAAACPPEVAASQEARIRELETQLEQAAAAAAAAAASAAPGNSSETEQMRANMQEMEQVPLTKHYNVTTRTTFVTTNVPAYLTYLTSLT
jgi:chromosome segregation ATPase